MRKNFGITADGKTDSLIILENARGTRAALTDYGAALVQFLFKDENGVPRDLVLGYDEVSGYEKGEVFFGGTIGRVANRIGGGRFELDGQNYELTRNDGPNTLHGGRDLYNKRIWDVEEETDTSVKFRLFSPDGDQGFPGNLNVTVRYSLSENDELTIEYTAESDQDTPLSLCNHSYFNLAGHSSGSVLSQTAVIHAEEITETDDNLLPTGDFIPVEGTPMDFREEKTLGQDIGEDYGPLKIAGGYDHNYVISGSGYREAAALSCPETGITMRVFTDLPGMQLYTGNFLDHEPGKGGAVYHSRDAVCFETQYYPDAINKEGFPGGVIRAGEVFRSRTCYAFSVEEKTSSQTDKEPVVYEVRGPVSSGKRAFLIVMGIIMLLCTGVWLIACLFAVGQLYNTYDLWLYLKDAPVAVIILLALFGAAVACFVLAFRSKKPPRGKESDCLTYYSYKDSEDENK